MFIHVCLGIVAEGASTRGFRVHTHTHRSIDLSISGSVDPWRAGAALEDSEFRAERTAIKSHCGVSSAQGPSSADPDSPTLHLNPALC